MYENLIGKKIDKNDEAFEGFPDFLNGHIFIEYDNGFIAEPPQTVPDAITMGQFRAMLIIMGMDTVVQEVIDSIPDELQRKLAQSDFEYRGSVERHHPLIEQFIALGRMTESEANQFFIEGAKR